MRYQPAPDAIGQLALKLTRLPAEELRLVAELVDLLDERRPSERKRALSIADLREEVKRRAELLREVPREQLVARFFELGEEIRQGVIAKGTAIEGDWEGD